MQKLDLTYTQHRIEYRNRIKQLMQVIEKKDKQLLRLATIVKTAGITQTDDGDEDDGLAIDRDEWELLDPG